MKFFSASCKTVICTYEDLQGLRRYALSIDTKIDDLG